MRRIKIPMLAVASNYLIGTDKKQGMGDEYFKIRTEQEFKNFLEDKGWESAGEFKTDTGKAFSDIKNKWFYVFNNEVTFVSASNVKQTKEESTSKNPIESILDLEKKMHHDLEKAVEGAKSSHKLSQTELELIDHAYKELFQEMENFFEAVGEANSQFLGRQEK